MNANAAHNTRLDKCGKHKGLKPLWCSNHHSITMQFVNPTWADWLEPSRAKVIIITECMKVIYTIERMKQGEITLIGFANTLPRAQNSKNDPKYSMWPRGQKLFGHTVQPAPHFLCYCLLKYCKKALFWSTEESFIICFFKLYYIMNTRFKKYNNAPKIWLTLVRNKYKGALFS